MTSLELLLLSLCFMAATFCFYLWAAIREDKQLFARYFIRIFLFTAGALGYTAVLVSILIAVKD
jgi:hypothetical protein